MNLLIFISKKFSGFHLPVTNLCTSIFISVFLRVLLSLVLLKNTAYVTFLNTCGLFPLLFRAHLCRLINYFHKVLQSQKMACTIASYSFGNNALLYIINFHVSILIRTCLVFWCSVKIWVT